VVNQEDEFMTLGEATDLLGVSKFKMQSLVKQGMLRTFSNPLDLRERLVRREDVEALRRPRVMEVIEEGKAAA
jgi:hypothetical protein